MSGLVTVNADDDPSILLVLGSVCLADKFEGSCNMFGVPESSVCDRPQLETN